MADFRQTGGVPTLAEALGMMQQSSQLQAGRENDINKLVKAKQLEQDQRNQNMQTAQAFSNEHPDMGISVGPETVSLQPKPSLGVYDLRKENQIQSKMADYSKRLEKVSGFSSALADVEGITNRDGKGGILTNPGANLISAGKIESGVGSGMLGLGEMVGMIPKGTTEERKTIDRLQLEYQKSISGARVTEQMRQAEREAMGMIKSGDPALQAKGIRSLARNVQRATQTIQAGYDPEVQDRVHSQLGNPMDSFNGIFEDKPMPQQRPPTKTTGNFDASGGASRPTTIATPDQQAPAQSPVAPQAPGKPLSFEEFKAKRAAGQL